MLEFFNPEPNGLRRMIFALTLVALTLWYTGASIDLSKLFGNQFVNTIGPPISNRQLGGVFLAAFGFLAVRAGLVLGAEWRLAGRTTEKLEERIAEAKGYAQTVSTCAAGIARLQGQMDQFQMSLAQIKDLEIASREELDLIKKILPHMALLAQMENQSAASETLGQLTQQMAKIHASLLERETGMNKECLEYYRRGQRGGPDDEPYRMPETVESLSWAFDTYKDIDRASASVHTRWQTFIAGVEAIDGARTFLDHRSVEILRQVGRMMDQIEQQLIRLHQAPEIAIPQEVALKAVATTQGVSLLRWDQRISNGIAALCLAIGVVVSGLMIWHGPTTGPAQAAVSPSAATAISR